MKRWRRRLGGLILAAGIVPCVLDRDPFAPTFLNRRLSDFYTVSSELVRWTWTWYQRLGAIGARSRVARRFGSFGEGSIIGFPLASLVNESAIHIGSGTVINPQVTLSAGWMPNQPDLDGPIVTIGDRCLIGRGSTIVGHKSIIIGDDVWTGHGIHITDMNHGYEDRDLPISQQHQPEAPVVIGDGSWLGHNVVVLPGVTIGRHVAVGAGSIVTGDIPDFSVAVGVPARVIRHFDSDVGWTRCR